MLEDIKKDARIRMGKSLESLRTELAKIRTGRAHPAMFNRLEADYYGTPTPLQQLASFTSPDPKSLLITPYDRGALANIEKAIRDSDLGVNPSNDGNAIRIVVPPLTEERRKEYIKMARHKAEEGRVAIRNVRRHANDQLKKLQKDGEISEDELSRAEKSMDALTKSTIEHVDQLLKSKEAELSEV